MENDAAKWNWLASRADEYVAEGKVLIFVLSKTGVEEVAASLRRYDDRKTYSPLVIYLKYV